MPKPIHTRKQGFFWGADSTCGLQAQVLNSALILPSQILGTVQREHTSAARSLKSGLRSKRTRNKIHDKASLGHLCIFTRDGRAVNQLCFCCNKAEEARRRKVQAKWDVQSQQATFAFASGSGNKKWKLAERLVCAWRASRLEKNQMLWPRPPTNNLPHLAGPKLGLALRHRFEDQALEAERFRTLDGQERGRSKSSSCEMDSIGATAALIFSLVAVWFSDRSSQAIRLGHWANFAKPSKKWMGHCTLEKPKLQSQNLDKALEVAGPVDHGGKPVYIYIYYMYIFLTVHIALRVRREDPVRQSKTKENGSKHLASVRETISPRTNMDWGRGHSLGGVSISLANVWSRWFYWLVSQRLSL